MIIKTVVLSIMLIVAPALTSAASVYKWIDDNGIPHFGDRQPAGIKSEPVNIKTGSTNSGGQTLSAQEQVRAIDDSRGERAERANLSAVEEARQKQRKANCETAQSNLKVINSNARIRVEDNGEQRYLAPEEIEEQRQKFRQIADDNCSPEAE
ncbi:DUF4124 domain-containing protein [Marinobacter changyiensis]|uniref:DUF4124 domain-containing protein n=1 Tax=Marinobacter changyiensis TaxID=2604091 RepID=UPI0012651FE4|nr:DUF4124 domain-containing protein [Marinobacter changyiensis]